VSVCHNATCPDHMMLFALMTVTLFSSEYTQCAHSLRSCLHPLSEIRIFCRTQPVNTLYLRRVTVSILYIGEENAWDSYLIIMTKTVRNI
jgi:hypothetical protein